MTTLLLMTAGNTDIQVVIEDGDSKYRMIPEDTRAFHESLLGDREWIVDEMAVECREFSNNINNSNNGKSKDLKNSNYLIDNEGKVRLVPAKLKPIVDKIGGVDAAVVFGTWRDPSTKEGKNEPVAVGPVLAGWIEARNSGNILRARELALRRREPWDPEQSDWPGGVQWVNLLRDNERLEGDDPVPRPLSPKLVARLHAALDRLQEDLSPDRVIIARTGAFPEVKQLIIPVANLFFGHESVEIWEVPQRSGKAIKLGAYDQQSPVVAYHLREAALTHVRKGDLDGAAAFAERVSGDVLEKHWACAVKAAADWFAGRGPVPDDAPVYLRRLNGIGLRCFLAAARAEAALRGDRFQEAIIASATFLDAALLDAIQKLDWVADIDEVRRLLTVRSGKTPPPSLTSGDKPALKPRAGGWSYWTDGTRKKNLWINEMDNVVKNALNRMRTALDSGNPRVMNYRNAAVHGRLVGKDMKEAVKGFKHAGVWSGDKPLHFLHLDGPAAGVLKALGAPDALSLFEAVFEGLKAEIKSCGGEVLDPRGGVDSAEARADG